MNPPAELPAWEQLRVRQAESDYAAVAKDVRIAYALWCVTGLLGGHRFYLGDTARSMAMLFTLGGLGVWTLVDLFLVARRVRTVNRTRRAAVMARYHLLDGTAESR
ncbi:TM2 domain-containing protein [Actinoplanes sp. RD1]|uniref:TM2 domain-containing protein n=1 Tax=Actinoplanes sp. RD1 TaxID=3064538 RepID=UPI002740EE90|nr:TM2 domain-containing protein [Actinoplanes sp. RD1]